MSETKKLIDALSVGLIAEAVGVDPRTVANKAGGLLPAYWFLAVSELAAARGVECPASAFAFARSGVSTITPEASAKRQRNGKAASERAA